MSAGDLFTDGALFPGRLGGGYDTQVLVDSPVGYWPSSEASGTTLFDASGNNRNLSVVGATLGARTAFPFNLPGPDYDGNDYATSSPVNWWSGVSGCAIEVWVRFDAIVAGQPGNINSIFGDLTSGNNGCLLRCDGVSGSTLPLVWYLGSSSGLASTPAYNLTVDTDYHIVGSWNGTTMRLYVNGVEVRSESHSSPATFNMATRIASSEGGRFLDGCVHHAALYNTPLSAARVLAHYDTALAA
jgi:hypothetical protein